MLSFSVKAIFSSFHAMLSRFSIRKALAVVLIVSLLGSVVIPSLSTPALAAGALITPTRLSAPLGMTPDTTIPKLPKNNISPTVSVTPLPRVVATSSKVLGLSGSSSPSNNIFTGCKYFGLYTNGGTGGVDTGATTATHPFSGYANTNASGSDLITEDILPCASSDKPTSGAKVIIHTSASGSTGTYGVGVDYGSGAFTTVLAGQSGDVTFYATGAGAPIASMRLDIAFSGTTSGDTSIITGIDVIPSTMTDVRTTTPQISLNHTKQSSGYTFDMIASTGGVLTGVTLSLDPGLGLPASTLTGILWTATSGATNTMINSSTVTAVVGFDPTNNLNVITIPFGTSVTLAAGDIIHLSLPNIINPKAILTLLNGNVTLPFATPDIKPLGTVGLYSDTTSLGIVAVAPSTSQQLHLFFNKSVSLQQSSQFIVSG